ncbi:MAG: HAMP domain-containing protein [Candidatus Omnitrophica bacterium]|nr:HAMP domain-containing protein [Candidatus Omnitrophota bacterium]
MNRSIRFTLSLWYIGTLAVILCFFGGAFYLNEVVGLNRDLDRTLVLQADGIADSIFAFREAERSATRTAPGNWQAAPLSSLSGEVERGLLPDLVDRWAEKAGNIEDGRLIRLIDRYGRPLIASDGFRRLGLPPLEGRTLEEANRRNSVYHTFPTLRRRFRLITRPVVEHDRVIYLAQVAAPLDVIDASLRRLALLLFWLIPLTLAATSAVGWFLARTALEPVGRMTRQAQQISEAALDRRVEVPRTGDEMEQLAKAFNMMLERLERAFRRMRQFSAAASHELRTPLTIMRGELEVSLRRARQPQEYQQVLHTTLEAIDEMTHTLEELLALARADLVDKAIEWQPVELTALARHESGLRQSLARDKRVQLEVLGDGPVWVRGDRRLLERLVSNLLDNALRYTPAAGTVTVRVDHWRNRASLIVQDTGPGIPPEELPRIFDLFFNNSSAAKNRRSTGLGLGLCSWIAEVHHGRIEVNSPPGHGATFTAWLPLFSPPA